MLSAWVEANLFLSRGGPWRGEPLRHRRARHANPLAPGCRVQPAEWRSREDGEPLCLMPHALANARIACSPVPDGGPMEDEASRVSGRHPRALPMALLETIPG